MNNDEIIRTLNESLDELERMVRTQADYIAELERERDALAADLKAMIARCPDPNDSVIDLVKD